MAFVKISNDHRVQRWTISRPERGNALGTTIAGELTAAMAALHLDLAKRDQPTQVLVVTADPIAKATRRTWIAGGDLKELATLPTTAAAHAYGSSLASLLSGFDELTIPVVMAIDGAAIGGGAELAIAGDVRLATRASTWEWKQLRVGLTTGYASAARLIGAVGAARAQGLLFLGQTLSADEALSCGLVHRLASDAAELEAMIQSVVADLCSLAPQALAGQKEIMRLYRADASLRQAELEIFASTWRNRHHAAFLHRYGGS